MEVIAGTDPFLTDDMRRIISSLTEETINNVFLNNVTIMYRKRVIKVKGL
jgi:hypothetical protein